ncbi:MAG: hypothetical protein ACKOD1_00035, partial [Sphingomonadales bacterium]
QRENALIAIKYAQFIGLSSSLRFEGEWTRKKVTISDCEFVENNSATPVVSVLNPRYEAGFDNRNIEFTLERSLFTKNGAALYFEDFNNPNLSSSVVNNVFVNNRITDFGVYNFSGNVLFGRADKSDLSTSTVLEGNSFLQNFLVSVVSDTIVQRVSVGIFGNADSALAIRNFWGTHLLASIKDGVYDFYKNYTVPRLVVEPFLNTPPAEGPPHIFRACLANRASRDTLSACHLLERGVSFNGQEVLDIDLFSNKALRSENAQVAYTWLNDSLQQTTRLLRASFRTDEESQKIVLTLESSNVYGSVNSPGYISVEGFLGENGETVPALLIGYDTYLREKYLLLKRADSLQRANVKNGTLSEREGEVAAVTTSPLPIKRSRFYLVGGANVSSQLVYDTRPLQQLIFSFESLNNSFLHPGLYGGFRWDIRLFKPVSASLMLGYTYLRTTANIKGYDTLPPFGTQFTSFMPRNSFQLLGAQAGLRATLLSSLSVLGGAAVDHNLTQRTSVDEQTPSYRPYFFGYYAGLEAALPSRKQLPAILVGIKWRRWHSNVAVFGVTNQMDVVELNTVFSLSRTNIKFKKSKR